MLIKEEFVIEFEKLVEVKFFKNKERSSEESKRTSQNIWRKNEW